MSYGLTSMKKAFEIYHKKFQHVIQNIFRITADGDDRITADGDARVTADSDI